MRFTYNADELNELSKKDLVPVLWSVRPKNLPRGERIFPDIANVIRQFLFIVHHAAKTANLPRKINLCGFLN